MSKTDDPVRKGLKTLVDLGLKVLTTLGAVFAAPLWGFKVMGTWRVKESFSMADMRKASFPPICRMILKHKTLNL